MSNEYAISVENLNKSYKDLEVLKGLNLQIKKGSVLALLGPNGAGKTTTVRILSTLLAPDDGEVRVNGYDVVHQAHDVRSSIGLTGQYAAVDEYLSARENLHMMGRLYHLDMKDVKKRTQELLEQFDLTSAADRSVKTFSGGMRRRLDLAASLIATPPILILDEPTTGLDPRSRLMLWDIIEKLVAADVTILLTTQYLDEADRLADRIAVLDQGRIIVEGTAKELKSKVGQERIELVIKDGNDTKTENIPTDGSVKHIKQVLDDMQAKGVEIESLAVHKPTLDDVFMHFTGTHVKENNQDNHDAGVQN